jgi:hypothetical protein
MRELKNTYETAAGYASSALRDAEKRGLSQLTVQSQAALEQQLQRGANLISEAAGEAVPRTVRRGSSLITRIDQQYLTDVITGQRLLDLREDLGITAAGLRAVAAGVDDRVVAATINRIWQDGYSLSERVWRVGTDYQEQIKRVVSAGLAQGRDTVKLARDVEIYVRDGRRRLAQRYGPNLEVGTKRWLRRIRGSVDYRALRLVRSELYASLQDAGRESGRANPAGQDWYDWILEPDRQQWNCECPDLADGSPYHYQDVPGYPHSNCQCRVQVQLRDSREFTTDLRRWAQGEQVDYIDAWYREFYLPAVG